MVVLCLSWGFNQVATKLAIHDVPPVIQAAIRSAGAALLICIWCAVRGTKLFSRDGTLWPGLAAGLFFAIEFILIYRGLLYTTATRAVLFIYLAPFFVVLGARIVATWGDPDLAAAVASAMTKVEAVLPEGLRRVVLETPLFAPGVPRASAMAGEVALLRRVISERRIVHFSYGREDGTESERDARPLGLYFWGKKWTLAAWCELRTDFRNFRLDRVGRSSSGSRSGW